MQFIRFGDDRVGCLAEGRVIDVTGLLPQQNEPTDHMTTLIASWDSLRPEIERLVGSEAGVAEADVRPLAPLHRPAKILAAPANYREHTAEMVELVGHQVIENFKGFLKAPSSILGPGGTVVLPLPGRRVDYEGELGLVIGHRASRVRAEEALDYVFGYLPLLDMTIRGEEDRSWRKSADTFTPIGPAIVTADEVGDPGALSLQLWQNDTLRQKANTADLVWDVARLIEVYSEIMTLEPGDIIATGTPSGIGPVEAGDRLRLTIERVGTLEVSVGISAGVRA